MALTKITSTNIGANAVTSSALSNTALITALGYTPANKAGDTFTNNINIGYDGYPSLKYKNAAGTDKAEIYVGTSAGDLNIVVGAGAAIAIDSSARIRMQYQPCFHAGKYDDGGQIASGVYIFNSVDLNTGSCYNNTNGRFTAPVAGNYYFIATQQLYGSSSGSADVRFYKNGSAYLANSPESYGQVPNSTTHQTITHMAIIPLAAGDYVTVYRNMPTRGMQSHFCGWLIS